MGIAVFESDSLLMFSWRFLWLFKTNFITKSNKIKILKKLYVNHFLASNNIKREKYLNESLFLKFCDILYNKPRRWSQKFAVCVTILMSSDEIRRFDGIDVERQMLSKNIVQCTYPRRTMAGPSSTVWHPPPRRGQTAGGRRSRWSPAQTRLTTSSIT